MFGTMSIIYECLNSINKLAGLNTNRFFVKEEEVEEEANEEDEEKFELTFEDITSFLSDILLRMKEIESFLMFKKKGIEVLGMIT